MTEPEKNDPPVLMWRAWAMPSPETFSILPIARLLDRWVPRDGVTVDPFARNSQVASVTNDLNPLTSAMYHLDALEFLEQIYATVRADAVLFDPPYSPRQISEVYQQVGRVCSTEDTQSARLYRLCRDACVALLRPGGVAISCGWNSAGFGKERGFTQREILIVAHGGAHNDTIVTVETYDAGTGSRAAQLSRRQSADDRHDFAGARLPL